MDRPAMIDLHCHLLPAFDDGAASLDEALAMARVALADGITEIVLTPHWSPAATTTQETIGQAAAVLVEGLRVQGLSLRLYEGAEVALDPQLLRLASDRQLPTVAGTAYLLVEPPFSELPRYTEQVLFELHARGYRPILAHPERCAGLQQGIARLRTLVQAGLLVQLNAGSLLGEYGPEVRHLARRLLSENLCHVLASDAHDLERRPPVLSAGVREAERLVGEPRALALVTTLPRAIVAGLPPPSLPPASAPGKRHWWSALLPRSR